MDGIVQKTIIDGIIEVLNALITSGASDIIKNGFSKTKYKFIYKLYLIKLVLNSKKISRIDKISVISIIPLTLLFNIFILKKFNILGLICEGTVWCESMYFMANFYANDYMREKARHLAKTNVFTDTKQ